MRWRDSTGREWRFVCNVLTMSRVKKETGVDLSQAIKSGSTIIEDVVSDVEVFFDVIKTLLRDQMDADGVTVEEFGAAINDEDVVADATRALIDALLDFFPPDRRAALKKAFRRFWELAKTQADMEAARVVEMVNNPEFEKMAKKAIENGKFNMELNRSNGVTN